MRRVIEGADIDEPWIRLILRGETTWKMRGTACHQKGQLALIRKEADRSLVSRTARYRCLPSRTRIAPRNQDTAFRWPGRRKLSLTYGGHLRSSTKRSRWIAQSPTTIAPVPGFGSISIQSLPRPSWHRPARSTPPCGRCRFTRAHPPLMSYVRRLHRPFPAGAQRCKGGSTGTWPTRHFPRRTMRTSISVCVRSSTSSRPRQSVGRTRRRWLIGFGPSANSPAARWTPKLRVQTAIACRRARRISPFTIERRPKTFLHNRARGVATRSSSAATVRTYTL